MTYTVAPPLPAGLRIDPATGVISGTPTVGASGTWTVTASDGVRTATADVTLSITAMTAQVPVPKLKLPKALKDPGCTVIVNGPVRTNAGQTATVRITAVKGIRTAGDRSADFKVVRTKGGKVSICVSGRVALTATVAITAKAVPGYTAYSLIKRYTVRKVR